MAKRFYPKMALASRIILSYKNQISGIYNCCSASNPQKTAFAIASSICIGVVPLVGFTFIIAFIFGVIFRLNQLLVQSVQILIAPIQILLLYPFIKAGQSIFQISGNWPVNIKPSIAGLLNGTNVYFDHFVKFLLAATGVWLISSIILGFVIYKILFSLIKNRQNHNRVI